MVLSTDAPLMSCIAICFHSASERPLKGDFSYMPQSAELIWHASAHLLISVSRVDSETSQNEACLLPKTRHYIPNASLGSSLHMAWCLHQLEAAANDSQLSTASCQVSAV